MNVVQWNRLSDAEKSNLLARPVITSSDDLREKVNVIIADVRSRGEQAVLELTAKFDRVQLNDLQVSDAELSNASQLIDQEARRAIEFAKLQLQINHTIQLPKTVTVQTGEGIWCERQARPIQRVGLYIPGGSAPLVSTMLMLGVPAELAGCPIRIICTPPNANGGIDPHILYAATLCGITQVFKVGGAQAIAAMAYGTKSIPKVDKIFGPGNAWVTQAKILVAQDPVGASIEMPAGPSEVLVIADSEADAEFVAADLLSQAEHGPDSQVLLVTTSTEMAKQVNDAIHRQLAGLKRYDIAKQALLNSRMIIVNTIEEAVAISNSYAPEHLILQVATPDQYVPQILNAGAVFLGQWAPETVGDYVTGSNHVLPTNGYAKSYSGLSVADFMKWISFQRVTHTGLKSIGPYAEKLADIEGLDAHQSAVSRRLAKMEETNE